MPSLSWISRSSLCSNWRNLLNFSTAESKRFLSISAKSPKTQKWLAALGVAAAGGLGLIYALENSVRASGVELHAPHHHWSHSGFFSTFDMASVRRGYLVYKNVCAACHSMKYIKYVYFVDSFMTEEEAKSEAKQIQVEDGPDLKTGKMYMRPGGLLDTLPAPYPNSAAAKNANNGADPPDLSRITLVKGEHGGGDYIFGLLTTYVDAPAGVTLDEGQVYNPYFPDGVLAMAQQLFDGMLEYPDGTPATVSQMAKDVTTYLTWCSEPQHDRHKLLRLQICMSAPILIFCMLYYYKFVWSSMKRQKDFWMALPFRGRKH